MRDMERSGSFWICICRCHQDKIAPALSWCAEAVGWSVTAKVSLHVASALAERGVAAASIEYRTADTSPYPAAVQDVKAAVRWMRANANQYGIDPDVVGTMGGSSGAYMALLVGLTPGIAEFEGNGGNGGTASAVQGVATMAVPSNLLTLTESNKLTAASSRLPFRSVSPAAGGTSCSAVEH